MTELPSAAKAVFYGEAIYGMAEAMPLTGVPYQARPLP